MSMFDMFTSKPAEAAPAPAPAAEPAQPGNLPKDGAVDATVPAAPAAEAQAPSNPLDQYKDLWENVPNKEGEEQTSGFVPLDPTKLKEIIAKASFTDTVTPESMQAITQGGDGAVEAFQSSMNAVAQQVMMQATLASNKMTEQAVTKALEQQAAKFPQMLKQQTTLDSNPLFSNPAIKPVMEAVQSQLAVKNPNATAAELATMTKEFVTVMGEQFAPKPANTNSNSQEPDWNQFFTS